MRPWSFSVIVAFFLCLVVPTASQGQQGSGEVSPQVLTVEKLRTLLGKAEAEGYRVDVQEQSCDFLKQPKECSTKLVKVHMVKEGKTQEGRGILDIKWDQREVWNVYYVLEDNKLKLAGSEGSREQKPPVAGTWNQTGKLVGLPAPLQVGPGQ